jgi:hypothetical protein
LIVRVSDFLVTFGMLGIFLLPIDNPGQHLFKPDIAKEYSVG